MQDMGNIRQDFGATILLSRSLAQSRRFQQAPQLAGQDRGLGSKIFVEEVVVGIVQERSGSDDLVENHQRCSHE